MVKESTCKHGIFTPDGGCFEECAGIEENIALSARVAELEDLTGTNLIIDPMNLIRDRAGKAYVWATANQLPPHDRLDDAAIPEIVRRHFEEDVPALMAEIAWLRERLAAALSDVTHECAS